jgi:hypothetical protein
MFPVFLCICFLFPEYCSFCISICFAYHPYFSNVNFPDIRFYIYIYIYSVRFFNLGPLAITPFYIYLYLFQVLHISIESTCILDGFGRVNLILIFNLYQATISSNTLCMHTHVPSVRIGHCYSRAGISVFTLAQSVTDQCLIVKPGPFLFGDQIKLA